MKKQSLFPSILFVTLGTLCAVLALGAALIFLEKPACLWEVPDEAVSCAQELMDCICRSDYSGVSQQLQGHPDLGLDQQHEDAITAMLWQAYQSGCSYRFDGEMYSTETGLAQNVQFEALDLNMVLERAGALWPELLSAQLDSMESTNSVYDENGNLKEEVIRQALFSAVEQVLQQDLPMTRTDLTLGLVYQDHQWLIKSDGVLLKIICGGIAA